MLFNEPKLLKYVPGAGPDNSLTRFSALQRAEIAEIRRRHLAMMCLGSFSALQRAEIAEIRQRLIARVRHRVFQCSSTSRNC